MVGFRRAQAAVADARRTVGNSAVVAVVALVLSVAAIIIALVKHG